MCADNEVAEAYGALVARFRLRVLESAAEYEEAAALASELAIKGEEHLTPGELEYLDVLDILISDYDARHAAALPKAKPHEVLRHLMESNGMKPADLAKIVGSQPLVSLILTGKRELSKKAIARLSEHFRVSPAVFF
jgi:HTH-type transcriptional regulator/antitoxin HigA